MKTRQFDLQTFDTVFNLACQDGQDPARLALEAGRRAAAIAAAREYEAKMQRLLSECPGFIGADAPASASSVGKVVIDPGKIVEAMPWLKRRFVVNENLELSHDTGLCVEVIPRQKGKASGKRLRNRFDKPEQFRLEL